MNVPEFVQLPPNVIVLVPSVPLEALRVPVLFIVRKSVRVISNPSVMRVSPPLMVRSWAVRSFVSVTVPGELPITTWPRLLVPGLRLKSPLNWNWPVEVALVKVSLANVTAP